MSRSRKIYAAGSRSDIRVPMREITLSGGEPPLTLYDTSGPYTDPDAHTDIKRGLPPLRLPWVLGRADVEQLPGIDGYEATRRIKGNDALRRIPLIVVTSYALSGDDAKALAAGADAYVAKPFSPRAMLAKVREYLG